MRKTRKRIIGAATAVSALALMLTGCSENTGTTSASSSAAGVTIDAAHSVGAMDNYNVGTTFKATEPVNISLLYRDMPNYPVQNNWMIFQKLTANQNVSFTRTDIQFSDWQTKRGLTVSGGDAPEVMPVFYSGEETPYVSSGVLLPISDYVQYMPNFQKDLQQFGLSDYLDTKRQSDGKYYQLPGLMEIAKIQYSIIVRDDAWKAAGLTDDPATMDDLTTALQKLQQTGMCGSTALSTANNAKDILQGFAPGYNTQAGDWMWQGGSAYWDASQNPATYVFSGAQDQYKSLLSYMANWVSTGVMDKESLTQSTSDNTQAEAKFTSGQVCATTGNDQDAGKYQQELNGNGINTTVHMLRIPAGPYGDYITGGQRFSSGMIFGAKLAQDPHFKAILQFVDWLYYSPEGIEFAQWGVQCPSGVTDSTQCTYTKDSSGTRKLLTDINNNQNLNPGSDRKNLTSVYGFSNGVFWPANGTFKDLMLSYYSPIMQDFSNKMADKKELPTPPATPMDQDTLDQVAGYYTPLRDMENTNLTNFILGTQSIDSGWANYTSQLKSNNMDQYIQLYNSSVKQ